MTYEEAAKLKRGDYIIYKGNKWEVLYVREYTWGAEYYVRIKARHRGAVSWFIDPVYVDKFE